MIRNLRRVAAAVLLVCVSGGASFGATATVQHRMTETTGTSLADSGPATTIPLTLTVGSGAFSSITAGKGFTFAANACADSGSLASSKLANTSTGVASATQLTLEVVLDTTNATAFDQIYGFSNSTFDESCALYMGSTGTNQICFECPAGAAVCYDQTPGFHVLYAIYDSPNATSSSRNLLYIDNVLATVNTTPTAAVYPTLNAAADAGFTNWANQRLDIGCYVSTAVAQGFVGPIYYAATYARYVFTSGDRSSHYTALVANNDADPNGGAVASPDPFFLAYSMGPLCGAGGGRDEAAGVWWPSSAPVDHAMWCGL